MARLINGALSVGDVVPTENPGEFTVTDAVFESITATDGAFVLTPGFVVYLPVVDAFAFMPLPGVFHRFRLTDVTPGPDGVLVSFTMLWDEPGEMEDYPLANSKWLVSQTSPSRKYGNPAPEAFYEGLPVGITVGAMLLDQIGITEEISGGSGEGAVTYVYTRGSAATSWPVSHNKDNSNFTLSVYDSTGDLVIPDSVGINNSNQVTIEFAQATAGTAVLVFAV